MAGTLLAQSAFNMKRQTGFQFLTRTQTVIARATFAVLLAAGCTSSSAESELAPEPATAKGDAQATPVNPLVGSFYFSKTFRKGPDGPFMIFHTLERITFNANNTFYSYGEDRPGLILTGMYDVKPATSPQPDKFGGGLDVRLIYIGRGVGEKAGIGAFYARESKALTQTNPSGNGNPPETVLVFQNSTKDSYSRTLPEMPKWAGAVAGDDCGKYSDRFATFSLPPCVAGLTCTGPRKADMSSQPDLHTCK
jgi:hypothetical protein